MLNDGSWYPPDYPRIPPGLIFLIGLVAGVLIGLSAPVAYRMIVQDSSKAPLWNSTALIFVGRAENCFYVSNRTGADYRLDPRDAILLQKEKLGLVATAARLMGPTFIPAGESAGLTIEPMPKEDLVLLDLSRRFRVDLKVK